MRKKTLIITLFICMILFLTNHFEASASDDSSQEGEISLYCLSPSYEDLIQIPSEYLTSYTISASNPVITSGESIVIENGTIKPKSTINYYHQLPSGFWVSSSTPTETKGEIKKTEYTTGDSTVEFEDGTSIVFHVKDYAQEYAKQTMNTYLEENITPEMSELEKAKKCCEFVCSYSYGSNSSTYVGMIVTGSGDCWASTSTLLYMLNKLEITSASRDASHDTGAGNRHINAIAKLDGGDYIIDVGINANVPRPYYITQYTSNFTYTILSDSTISITGYFDYEEVEELEIPSEIEGYTVSSIGDGAFSNYKSLTSVTLPDTITSIGVDAFKYCTSLTSITLPEHLTTLGSVCFYSAEALKEINIPASVTSIGTGCFAECNALYAINVDSNNPSYYSEDGILYNKDQTSLLQYPCGRKNEDYVLPDTVTTIKTWAFRSTILRHLTLHNNLTSMEPFAFQYMFLPFLRIPDSFSSIGSSVFENAYISKIELPDTITRIEDGAFARGHFSEINLPEHLEYIGMEAFIGNYFLKRIYVPSSVKEIGDGAFALDYGWSSMDPDGYSYVNHCILFEKGSDIAFGEHVFSDVVIGVEPDSSVESYAVNNNVPYLELDDSGKIPLQDSWFDKTSNYQYTGVEILPEVSFSKTNSPLKLQEDLDYVVAGSNNISPGTATLTLTGNRLFSGTITRTFQISKDSYFFPKSFTKGFSLQNNAVQLFWNKVYSVYRYGNWYMTDVTRSPLATYYEIYRQKAGESTSIKVGTTSDLTWTDKSVQNNVKYIYTIKAYDEDGFITSIQRSVWYLQPVKLISATYTLRSPKIMTVTVTWNTVPGAESYQVHRKLKGSTGEGATVIEPVSGSTMSYEFLLNTGDYDIWVTAHKGAFESAALDIRTPSEASGFTISSGSGSSSGKQTNTTRPATPKLTKLRNISSRKLQIRWQKVSKAKGYQIQYSTSSKFKKAKLVKITRNGTTKTTLKKLKKGKTLYIRIRSYTKSGNTTVYSKWSSTKKIKIKK